MPTRAAEPLTPGCVSGLVLTGGGARAAYQVGVLRAIHDLLIERQGLALANPFAIICGTSAGAVNATALGCGAADTGAALRRLETFWSHITTERVYRADSLGVIRTGARWLAMLSFGWAMMRRRHGVGPQALLDNSPLGELLTQALDFERLQLALSDGTLRALAVTASGYTSGRHLTFYQSAHPIAPWQRALRLSVPDTITVPHILASSAIPFIFPAHDLQVGQQREWCGDGAMRQLAPISPAIHLGADRILVIGAGRAQENPARARDAGYPSLAQIAGHALSNIFLDSLSADIEQVARINRGAAVLSPAQREQLGIRPIDVLAITPSRNLDEIAMRHLDALPTSIRALLGAVGVSNRDGRQGGAGLLSYLLFEPPYTRELLSLGYADGLSRRDDVLTFFNPACHT